MLAELSPAARAMLDHVEAGSGEADAGTARHTITPAEAESPAEELLSRGLLVPGTSRTRAHPGRGAGRAPGRSDDAPADRRTTGGGDVRALGGPRGSGGGGRGLRRRTPGGAARRPLGRRSAGRPAHGRGGGARPQGRRGRPSSWTSPRPPLLIEVSAAAGLLATWPDADGNPSWTPTDAFDSWCDAAGRGPVASTRDGLAGDRAAPVPRRHARRERARRATPSIPSSPAGSPPRRAAMTLAALAELPAGAGAGHRHRVRRPWSRT